MKLFDTETALQKKYPLITGKDSPILRTVCDEVNKLTPEIIEFAKNLQELMWSYDGVGLAAPQIGQNTRMAAISQRDTTSLDDEGRTKWELIEEFVIINPEILSTGDLTDIDNEACLSLPGISGNVERPKKVTIKYLGIDNKIHVHKATGFNARVILHEMDHLDGVLFIDKLVT